MTVEYLVYQLIAGYGKDEEITAWIDSYDFYVIPVINPDGFIYTQTTERLWRKSRLPPLPGANQSAPCWGIDLNRNWPNEWDTNPEGSSPDPCTQTYRGQSPGDAVS
jgi:murein tripeptide amidase MpaA